MLAVKLWTLAKLFSHVACALSEPSVKHFAPILWNIRFPGEIYSLRQFFKKKSETKLFQMWSVPIRFIAIFLLFQSHNLLLGPLMSMFPNSKT